MHYRLYKEKFQQKPGTLVYLYLVCTKTFAFILNFLPAHMVFFPETQDTLKGKIFQKIILRKDSF